MLMCCFLQVSWDAFTTKLIFFSNPDKVFCVPISHTNAHAHIHTYISNKNGINFLN